MRARRVKGLDPAASLADNAERMVRTRLDELYSFTPKALNPKRVKALHDMRIAAKRLRYVLEITSFCFGPYASTATKRAKELQDLLGEIHDAYGGLEVLAVWLEARRTLLFERFLDRWKTLQRQAFRERLERALDDRAPETDSLQHPTDGQVESKATA